MKKVIYFLIKLFSCLFIKNKNIYVFGAWFGKKYSDNSKAMFLYYLENSNKKCYWVTKNNEIYNMLKKQGMPVVYYWSLKGIFIQLHSSVGFICTGSDINLALMGRSTIIQLWHGVGGGKKIGLDAGWYNTKFKKFFYKLDLRTFKNYFWVTPSNTFINIFSNAFMIKKNNFILAGQPRNDIFFKSPDKTFIKSELSLDTNSSIILYVPTHRNEGKNIFPIYDIFNFDDLNKFCKENNFYFLIKKHFYHRNENVDLSNYSNIIDITNNSIDVNLLLVISDIVISDYSSITADYLLLNKPIIYYCFDLENYKENDRELYWKYEDITPGDICYNYNDVKKALNDLIVEKNDKYFEDRIRVRRMFCDDSFIKVCAPSIESKINEKIFRK